MWRTIHLPSTGDSDLALDFVEDDGSFAGVFGNDDDEIAEGFGTTTRRLLRVLRTTTRRLLGVLQTTRGRCVTCTSHGGWGFDEWIETGKVEAEGVEERVVNKQSTHINVCHIWHASTHMLWSNTRLHRHCSGSIYVTWASAASTGSPSCLYNGWIQVLLVP